MAAHCINDVITCGADPLILLDYVAANQLDLEQVAELVEGAADVCRAAGVALIGGETAELPGVYREGELDFAATCVGIVERDRVIDGSAVRAGDVVVGLALGRRSRERVHARPAGARARGLRRARSARADPALPRRRPPAARDRARVRARHRRRDRGKPEPRDPGRAPGRARLGRLGAAAGVRLARRATSTRRRLRRVFNLGIGYCAVVASPEETTWSSAGSSTRDRRPRQRRGIEPAGPARRRASRRRGRVEPGRRAGAGARRGGRGARRGVPARRVRRPRAARRDDGELAAGARRATRCLRRLHAPAHVRVPRALSRADRQRRIPRCCPSSPEYARSTRRWKPASRRPASPCTSSTRASTRAP